ncbi:hypothetical protein L596_023757 [Steinernema carpocapsae]|uniref:PDZ domain-containing protein n=1 Tax=Steinernema carpocapsae TaxID=34508 RepID=A0A4U5MEL4_STECR|nr:hypothetical protein L596_023757 [Steinernema carpocapsae]
MKRDADRPRRPFQLERGFEGGRAMRPRDGKTSEDPPTVTTDSTYETNLGYPSCIPKRVFEEKDIVVRSVSGKIPSLRVSKTLVTLIVPKNSPCFSLIECGDFVRSVNGKLMESKKDLYEALNAMAGTDGSTTIVVTRPRRFVKLASDEVMKNLPAVYERLPGFDYLFAYMVVFPGAKIGLHVKSYNEKIYVVKCDEESLAEASFAIGDAILSIDDKPVTVVADAVSVIAETFKVKKYVQAVVERANTPQTTAIVRQALAADKTVPVDAKLCADTIQIGARFWKELERMGDPSRGALRNGIVPKTTSRLSIAQLAEECPIGTEPLNPNLLIHVMPPAPETPAKATPEAAKPEKSNKEKAATEEGSVRRRNAKPKKLKSDKQKEEEHSKRDIEVKELGKLKNILKKVRKSGRTRQKDQKDKSGDERSIERSDNFF